MILHEKLYSDEDNNPIVLIVAKIKKTTFAPSFEKLAKKYFPSD